MSEKASSVKPNIYPAIRYQNAPAALAWLDKAFGFKTHMEVLGPDGTIAHAEMKFGPGMIMLGSAREEPGNPWSTVNQGLYVYVEDVGAHYAQAKAAGAEIIRDLADTPYGSSEYSARDPEGNLWSFGTYLP